MKREIIDLNRRVVKEGDTVVVSKGWGNNVAYLVTGVVKEIIYTEKKTKAMIEITHDGLYAYEENCIRERECNDVGKVIGYEVPRYHVSIVVLNSKLA